MYVYIKYWIKDETKEINKTGEQILIEAYGYHCVGSVKRTEMKQVKCVYISLDSLSFSLEMITSMEWKTKSVVMEKIPNSEAEHKTQRTSRINWVFSLSTHYLHLNNYTTSILYWFPIDGFSLHLATPRDSFIKMHLNLCLIIRREKRSSEKYERENWKKAISNENFYKKKLMKLHAILRTVRFHAWAWQKKSQMPN